jgi:hypothetical protein
MKMLEVVDAYVTLQRSRGMRFDAANKMLRHFCRVLGNPDINQVSVDEVAKYIRGAGLPSATWTLKFKVLSAGLWPFCGRSSGVGHQLCQTLLEGSGLFGGSCACAPSRIIVPP